MRNFLVVIAILAKTKELVRRQKTEMDLTPAFVPNFITEYTVKTVRF